jgi:3-phenylpropionate/cinnamic acid dioxygenase small subunit
MRLGIIYATSRNMLVDRVMALRKANIYEPQRYRHLIANIRPLGQTTWREDAAWIDATANFIVVRTMQDGAMTVFAAGRYVDRLVRVDGGWKFARKDAVLDSRQIDTLLAIPI